MKTIYTFLVLALSITLGFSQGESNFEDGTLQNWTNTDGTIDAMSVQGPPGTMYLEKICDGTNSPVGEMAIMNIVDYNGDFTCNDPSQIDCWAGTYIYARNSNSFDMHYRFGLKNSNGTTVASDPAFIVPANSDWSDVFIFDGSQLFVVDGTESVADVVADVQELKIFHNPSLAYEGEVVTGKIEIDYLGYIILLSSEDELLKQTSIYPNPVTDSFSVEFANESDATITIFNILGEQVKNEVFISNGERVDISLLESGVYLATIKTENSSITKKIIKL